MYQFHWWFLELSLSVAVQTVRMNMYINWASKETYHFFRATLTKIQTIKMNHIWTQISYNTPYQAHLNKQLKFAWVKKEKHAVKSQHHFSKLTENCSPLRLGLCHRQKSVQQLHTVYAIYFAGVFNFANFASRVLFANLTTRKNINLRSRRMNATCVRNTIVVQYTCARARQDR